MQLSITLAAVALAAFVGGVVAGATSHKAQFVVFGLLLVVASFPFFVAKRLYPRPVWEERNKFETIVSEVTRGKHDAIVWLRNHKCDAADELGYRSIRPE